MSETRTGALAPKSVTIIGGSDGTNARALAVSSSGALTPDTTTASGVLSGDGTKNVTTAGTRVTLASSTACKWVAITARPANTGKIAVGVSTVVAAAGSERGIVLSAGDTVVLPVLDLNTVNIDATVSGEGVAFAYGT